MEKLSLKLSCKVVNATLYDDGEIEVEFNPMAAATSPSLSTINEAGVSKPGLLPAPLDEVLQVLRTSRFVYILSESGVWRKLTPWPDGRMEFRPIISEEAHLVGQLLMLFLRSPAPPAPKGDPEKPDEKPVRTSGSA